MADIEKWIGRPGKRRKTGKRQKTIGPDRKINPQWLEDKYDVTIERRHGGRALRGYGKAYLKGEKYVG